MRFKPKFYIVYPHSSVNDLEWECTTHYRCMGHIPNMLQELLNVKTIGSEIKWIIDNHHRYSLMEKYNVTSEDIDNYVKSNCGLISFTAKGTRSRALKEMKRLGAKEMYLADGYRDVLLSQANYRLYKTFEKFRMNFRS